VIAAREEADRRNPLAARGAASRRRMNGMR
jgi:hypothetical protein